MIDRFVRDEVRDLKSYPETALPCRIKMDANENEWGLPPEVKEAIIRDVLDFPFHRYPDSDGAALKKKLEEYTGVPAKTLLLETVRTS